MTRNAVIVLVGLVLYVCSSPRGTEASPTADVSVVDEMKKDKEVCDSSKPFINSQFTKICEKIKYPSGNITLNLNDPTQFLCLGLYDRSIRLCYLDTLSATGTSVLPNNATVFDADVKKIILTSKPKDIREFCDKWNNKYPPKYAKTSSYVIQLHEALKQPFGCLKICTSGDLPFNPMCSVLATMDHLSYLTGGKSDDVKESQEGKPVLKVEETQAQQPQQDAAVQKSKVETSVGGVDFQQQTENLPISSPDVTTKESLEQVSKAAANLEKPQQERHQETSDSVSSPATKSKQSDTEPQQPVAVTNPLEKKAGNDEHKEEAKSDKEQQTEKQTVETAQQTEGNGLSNNAKASDPLPPSVLSPQNQGTSGEDNTDTVGSVIDDQKPGVISQHTQDEPEDQFGGGDPAEALGETDLEDFLDDFTKPPSPDDDADLNSLQPSEKREYIPRMPSIPNEDDSHFFGYFTVFGVMCIAGYVGYHNKQKILAMVLEGRRSRGGRSRRRPSTANYRKLDCTLEEAVTSQCNSNVTHVIY